jgi:flagellin-like protein
VGELKPMVEMKRELRLRDRRGVSPVIATIIIVAIAIVMALAVAYWMLGLGGAFTRFEKLEFVSAYAEKTENDTKFNITVKIKNSGSADATIDLWFFNGKPQTAYSDNVTIDDSIKNVTLKPGEAKEGVIQLTIGDTWKSGMTVEVMIQTVSGRQYPKSVILP